MIFWVDAQLPPGLATYLRDHFKVEAQALRELGLRDASDATIFEQARAALAVVITKDSDFVELSLRHGPPPAVLLLTCGNCGNARLRDIFEKTFPDAIDLLLAGEAIVEISGT